jgi:hypothetical protein
MSEVRGWRPSQFNEGTEFPPRAGTSTSLVVANGQDAPQGHVIAGGALAKPRVTLVKSELPTCSDPDAGRSSDAEAIFLLVRKSILALGVKKARPTVGWSERAGTRRVGG